MKKTLLMIALISAWLTGSATARASEKFYQIAIAGKNIIPTHKDCNSKEVCFLTFPFADNYIDAAVKFYGNKAVIQFMYEKSYLDTTSLGDSTGEIEMHELPAETQIVLYRKNPQAENVIGVKQDPVVRRGTPLVRLNVTITDTP